MTTTAKRRVFATDKKSSLALYDLLSTGLVPEPLIRIGIRQMLKQKLKDLASLDGNLPHVRTQLFAEELKTYPIAIETDSANTQHYEVPSEFFELILGPRMKYSCCLFEDDYANERTSLAISEERMLNLTCRRADIQPGQRILDLGCGWGSFSIFAASEFPGVRITAVSNSQSQRLFIEGRARDLGLNNIEVITKDVNYLDFPPGSFDRVVSIEMFEHAKNYESLLSNIAKWLDDDGKLFVHIFTHKVHQYHYGESQDDWLARYFFSGGMMPSHSLLYAFQDDLEIEDSWKIDGRNYQITAEAWLQNMSRNRKKLLKIIAATYGAEQATRWWVYWRLFFLACAELWGYSNGSEWIVSHYRFHRKFRQSSAI